jgi:pimeloyl-ACP methyl ester carboxylesterase
LKYEDRGGGGPAVVFVHGWQADRSVWSEVAAALGPRVRSIAVDLPGFGESNTLPGPFTVERFAEDLRALIETLGAAPAIVVGHSMGGKVASRLAIAAPEVVGGLVLIAPVPLSAAGFSPKGEARLRATAGDPVAVKEWLARTIADPSNEEILERLCGAAAKASPAVALESYES